MVTTKESQIKVVSIVLLFMFLSLSLVCAQGITAKIGNAKTVLYPELKAKELIIDRTILVINDNTFPVNITIEPSLEYQNMITVGDKNFILQPGESKNASFMIRITKVGDYDGNLNVYFSKIGETGGVALSSKIILHVKGESSSNGSIFGNKMMWLSLISTLVLVFVLILLVWIIKKKKIRGKIKAKRVKVRNE